MDASTPINFFEQTDNHFWLKKINGRPGLNVRIKLEVPAIDLRSEGFLAHSSVSLAFTDEEIDHIAGAARSPR